MQALAFAPNPPIDVAVPSSRGLIGTAARAANGSIAALLVVNLADAAATLDVSMELPDCSGAPVCGSTYAAANEADVVRQSIRVGELTHVAAPVVGGELDNPCLWSGDCVLLVRGLGRSALGTSSNGIVDQPRRARRATLPGLQCAGTMLDACT